MANMNEFLLQYFMQLRFNNMPAEVRAKYMDYLNANGGKGDFRGHMGDWKKKLMQENPVGSGNWEEKALPDPTDQNGAFFLDDTQWESLFKTFQNAFRSMSAGRDGFKENSKAINFLDEYFGDASKLFSYATANSDATQQITNLKNAFDQYPQLEQAMKQANIVSADFSLSDFKSKLESKKYNKDPKFKEQLQDIAQGLEWLAQNNTNVAQMVRGVRFDAIANGFDSAIDLNKLHYFKQMYRPLLNSLATDSKIYGEFKNHDGGKITGQIDLAKQKIAYDDKGSDDYVPPKRKDELTPWQQLKDWAGNTYNDVLGKYLSKHGNVMYFSEFAKHIVQAIDGAKIQPTDGIKGVLGKAEDIKNKLLYKSPTATKHFEWFTKTMKELSDTMPKAFDGALKNGRQLNALVAELIIKAARDGKVDEAKTAMEVLSVIKYGYTTSKIMDAIGKEKLSIFSDGGLSWNKNAVVAFVTTALDKSIKKAFEGIGYGITIAGNAYKLNGSKFNGKRGRIKSAQENWQRQTNDSRNQIQTQRDNMANDRAIHQQTLDNLNTTFGINSNTIDQKRADLANARDREENLQHNVLRHQQRIQALQNRQARIPVERHQLAAQVQVINTEIHQMTQRRAQLMQFLMNPNPHNNIPQASVDAMLRSAAQELLDIGRAIQDKQRALTDMANKDRQLLAKLQSSAGRMPQFQQDLANAENNLRAVANANNIEDIRLNTWTDADDTVSTLNEQIDRHDTQLQEWEANHKDKYMELMAYWDLLETGRDSHTGPMYKWGLLRSVKASQKSFDQQKGNLINSYTSGYSYAA